MTIPKIRARTLNHRNAPVSIVIPAHNEAATIAAVVESSRAGLAALNVPGQVIVSASGCTDDTAEVAEAAGASVISAPIGKGAAIMAGLHHSSGDIVCLIDGDLSYYGDIPLATVLVEPILRGVADATIGNLYWRPIYPDHWLNGFFVPLAGYLCPEVLPKAGSTPWSGQRAAVRPLWPNSLPAGFTVDLALTLHWNEHAEQLRPIVTDDWYNPIRPKPEVLPQDFALLVDHALASGRLDPDVRPSLELWFDQIRRRIEAYDDDHPEPLSFQRDLLETSLRLLHDLVKP